MSALELPPQEDSEATSRNIRLLVVPQPSTDGQVCLASVRGEIDIIRKLASSSPLVDFQEADGTVENVLSKMTETDWVHFACHGTQDRTNPFDSGFLLAHGRRLKLSDIARVSRPHGGLAFLSACHTATGDEQLSEEAIHIAAGILLAGYRGAIATMWSIMDNDAPKVTEDVYESLFGDGKVPDSGQAAEALHHAIERLRDSGVSFLSWTPFIHVGL
jgi:CHAT domain-containing protein